MSTPSPTLQALLAKLRRSLTTGVWLHGGGTVVAVTALWLVFAALADYFLHLPAPIRIFHGIVAIGAPLYWLRRGLLSPLKRIPDEEGLALMLQRTDPESEDLLVSAIQLPDQVKDGPARPLVERVVARAEEHARSVDTNRVLDRRGPRRRAAFGLMALTASVVLATSKPALASIFFSRMTGSDARWPQLTYLSIEVPPTGHGVQVERDGNDIYVRAARGSDLAVLVRAEGKVPDDVTVHFSSGPSVILKETGAGLFRTLLRTVQEDLSFHVTGGDDDRAIERVHVTVLQPPDVTGVAWRVTPPAYSGLPTELSFGTDVEVLTGSEIEVYIETEPADANAVAHLLPGDTRQTLAAATFPAVDETTATQAARPAHTLSLTADMSMRLSFELSDDTGLPNPDPGLFAITVIDDHRPEILILAPGRSDMDVVLGGAVPLRARIEDDFGLASVVWDVRNVASPDEPLVTGPLEPEPIELSGTREVVAASARLEVAELGGIHPITEGMQISMQVIATDVREPVANEALSAPIRLRVVSGDDYLRKLQDHLARAGETARRLGELAEGKERMHRDLLDSAQGDDVDGALGDLTSMQHGMRRVQGDARALARDLAMVAEGMIYSRIDDRGAPLLGALDGIMRDTYDRSFRPEPWVELVDQYRGGALGQAELAGTLVEIVGLALDISETHFEDANLALQEAAAADDPKVAMEALGRVVDAQARGRIALEDLMMKLGEWDNFQSVLTLTRDILNRQKNLKQQTEQLAEDEEENDR